MVFFLSLLSHNFDDRLSSNFHKFVIYAYVEIHQVTRLVFDSFCPVSLIWEAFLYLNYSGAKCCPYFIKLFVLCFFLKLLFLNYFKSQVFYWTIACQTAGPSPITLLYHGILCFIMDLMFLHEIPRRFVSWDWRSSVNRALWKEFIKNFKPKPRVFPIVLNLWNLFISQVYCFRRPRLQFVCVKQIKILYVLFIFQLLVIKDTGHYW